jgi:hypothetical protein
MGEEQVTFSAITKRRAERTGSALLSWLRMVTLHPQQLPLDFLADGGCLSIPFELYTDGLGVSLWLH